MSRAASPSRGGRRCGWSPGSGGSTAVGLLLQLLGATVTVPQGAATSGADEVQALYARIAQDPRHHTLRVLSETTGDRLLMPTWAMAYTSPVLEPAKGDAFVLGFRQAQGICEMLPEHIARFFLEYLTEEAESA